MVITERRSQFDEHCLVKRDRPPGIPGGRIGYGQVVTDQERVGVIFAEPARTFSSAAS